MFDFMHVAVFIHICLCYHVHAPYPLWVEESIASMELELKRWSLFF